MEEHIIDGPDQSKSNGLTEALAWWEKKRLLYNVIVGISGLFTLFSLSGDFGVSELLIGALFFGIGANAFYSLGFLLESWNHHYLKNSIKFESVRLPLFLLGLIFSVGLTLLLAFAGFSVAGM
ncbi:MAG: hypothetical protein HWD92_07540 [Flavobacteriia bacterium]|nr:hypothetical protein [Flavobacteriia bacterium]